MAPMTFRYRSLPARSLVCRDCLRSRALSPVYLQRRWAGTKFIAKQLVADQMWDEKARQIELGTSPHPYDDLEKRGFVKDVVG